MEKLRSKVQLLLAVFFNIGFVQWHTICFPVLNCHSCPVSVFACPLGIIGQFAGLGLVPLAVVGTVALVGVVAGRILCGWACPFGFLQELLHKVPFVRFGLPGWTRFIKYGVLAVLVVGVPVVFSTDSPLYFCRLCPVGTIESAIPWAITEGTVNVFSLSVRLGILLAIVIMAMGHHRFFCKVLCPLGASMAMCNRFAAIFPQRTPRCVDCGVCNRVCPMEHSAQKGRFGVYDDRAEECISCLRCHSRCASQAIRLWG
ncbi:MAG: 4Fe-4S binding protein [Thermodesulfobacteriota bacterium]